MLAFGILDMDMNSNKRYSDVTIEQTIFTDSAANLASSTVLPFKPCRKEQWTGIIPQVKQGYDSLVMDELLCL